MRINYLSICKKLVYSFGILIMLSLMIGMVEVASLYTVLIQLKKTGKYLPLSEAPYQIATTAQCTKYAQRVYRYTLSESFCTEGQKYHLSFKVNHGKKKPLPTDILNFMNSLLWLMKQKHKL